MSNIFQPLVRETGGRLPLNIGDGPLVDPIKNQHLNLDSNGAIYASFDGVINHYGAGLPFDVDGRLIISTLDPIRFDQTIPFNSAQVLSVSEDPISHYSQGLAYTSDSSLAVNTNISFSVWQDVFFWDDSNTWNDLEGPQ